MISERFEKILKGAWANLFCQERSLLRAINFSKALCYAHRKKMITNIIEVLGRTDCDWSADYKLFSRSNWEKSGIFDVVMSTYLENFQTGPIVVAMDDTKFKRTGKKIKTASYHRDPMSPPFHTNLMLGQRFIQASLSFPHHQEGDFASRAYPIKFEEVPVVKKPGKKATKAEIEIYKEAKKEKSLSKSGLDIIKDLRSRFDSLGGSNRKLLFTVDGSYCNKIMFMEKIENVELVARCRKDAKLCFEAESGSRCKYSKDKFTPEQIRKNDEIKYKSVNVYYGGKRRKIEYKEVKDVLWQRGAKTRKLRMIVIAPLPYKLSPNARMNYRDPAYLLATDNEMDIGTLIQAYLDRWEIEVNHRDEKSVFGVGDAQVWNENSLHKQPAFVVATYSILLLAAYLEHGPGRSDEYIPLPKWRKESRRASLNDIQALMRKERNNETTNKAKNSGKPSINTQNCAMC